MEPLAQHIHFNSSTISKQSQNGDVERLLRFVDKSAIDLMCLIADRKEPFPGLRCFFGVLALCAHYEQTMSQL